MKKLLTMGRIQQILRSKFFKIIRNTLLLLMINVFHILATTSYSQGTTLSMELKDVTNKEILSSIEDQSEFIASEATMQPLQVTGFVRDADGMPVTGATILVKGTQTGTISDMEGKYSLSGVDREATLVFSFIGLETMEVPVDGRSTIDVVLSEATTDLDEVVVIGYQSVRKGDLTGATSVIDISETTKTMSNSIAESMQGLTPGVTVRNSGNPGTAPKLEIRGVASFLNSDPLYVIDGMISGVGPLVSPNNIESIQILKDASAAAIYGSRAANGVVIITTRQGQEGPARFQVSAKHGISQMPRSYEMMDSYQYAATVRQQYLNSGLPIPSSVVGPDGTAETFVPPYNTNWVDEVSRTGYQSDYNVTISGGSKTGKYLVSGGYYDNKGVIVGNSFDRMDLRINTSGSRGRFEFGENFIINYARRKHPNQGNPFLDMLGMLPIIPVRAEEYIGPENPWGWGIGSEDAVTYQWNIPGVNFINPQRTNTTKAVGNIFLKFRIFDWLDYKFNAGMETTFGNTKTILKDGIWRYTMGRGASSITEDRDNFTSVLFDHTLNFNKKWTLHNLNGVVGFSIQENESRGITASITDLQRFEDDYFEEVNSGIGESSGSGSTGQHFRTQGFLGRVNYAFDDRYLITLTGRYDQDSRFAKDFRSGFFPSVALAWKLNNESFFNSDVISMLKLRASVGKLGIVTVDSWDYIPLLNSNQRAIFGPGQLPYVGANAPQLTNEDLRWENRIMQNFGFDMGLLENRINISMEYYNSESKDALLNQVLGDYLGNLGGNPAVNAGGIINSGVEAVVTYKNSKNDFKWSLSANITTIKNEVVSVGNQGKNSLGEEIDYIQTGVSRSQVGRSIGEWYLIQTDGLFQSEAEVQSHVNSEGKVIQPLAKPGDVRFIDLNDDGSINQDDRKFSGSPWPKLQSGLQFNGWYNNFSVNLQIVGIFDYLIYNSTRINIDNYHNTNFRADLNPWAPDNTNGSDPRLGVPLGDVALTQNYQESDRWLEKGSYLRLRSIELAYDVPVGFIRTIGMNDIRVFANAQNLFTLTKYTGADPDVTGVGTHQRGTDNGNWPSDRIYSVGIQFSF